MGIFSRLMKGNPENHRTVGSSYGYTFGRSTAGPQVTARTSMQVAAVYACVRVLAEAFATLPLELRQYDDKRGSHKAVDRDLYQVLHDEANPEMSSFVFRETSMAHLLLWGNSYSQIIKNGRGETIALYPLMPWKMSVERDTETKELVYVYRTSNEEKDFKDKDASAVRLSARDILHIPALGFDGLVGYSPIAMAQNSVGQALACDEFGAKFFANGASPSGVLEHPGILKDPQRVRDSWNAAYGGTSNSHKVAVLEEGMKYTPISINPNEAQFLETRRFSVEEIARIFKVPPHMIGDLERSTFNNVEQMSLDFVKYSLNPWVARWEQGMTRRLIPQPERKMYYIQFNMEGLLRGDMQSRYNAYAVGRQNGWLSANDIRAKEGMDLIDPDLGGDRYLCNGNMVDIGSAGKEDKK